MSFLPTIPLFPPGRVVATPGILALLEQTNKSPLEFLSRHLRGDWGDLDQKDKAENELSLKYGFRLLSSYQVTETEKLWVITEADRSVIVIWNHILARGLNRSAPTDCRRNDHRQLRRRNVAPFLDVLVVCSIAFS